MKRIIYVCVINQIHILSCAELYTLYNNKVKISTSKSCLVAFYYRMLSSDNKPLASYCSKTSLLDLMDFPGGLVFPVTAVLQRPLELDGSGAGTLVNTTATVPAFIGMQYDGRFTFLWIRYENVYLADFHAGVASVADIRIKYYRRTRCGNIRNSH